jgi:hypothetical protein
LGKTTFEAFAGLFDDNLELKKFGLKQARAIDNGVLILEYQPIG